MLCLDESYFPLFGVLGGCGPAFAYMFIDAMARAGVKNGMKKSELCGAPKHLIPAQMR